MTIMSVFVSAHNSWISSSLFVANCAFWWSSRRRSLLWFFEVRVSRFRSIRFVLCWEVGSLKKENLCWWVGQSVVKMEMMLELVRRSWLHLQRCHMRVSWAWPETDLVTDSRQVDVMMEKDVDSHNQDGVAVVSENHRVRVRWGIFSKTFDYGQPP